MTISHDIRLSPLDLIRFGVKTAQVSSMSAQTLSESFEFCTANQVELLIARCSVNDLPTVQLMEENGFRLMDTLVYYVRDLVKMPIPQDVCLIPVRPIKKGDEEMVREIASRTFDGYLGHYHADPRLDKKLCDEVYVDWAYRSCVNRDVANEVLIADNDGTIVGFATLRRNSKEEGEGVLFGVDPSSQGQGIYRSFILKGMQWCLEQGMERMVVSTQVTNNAVQKVWVRVGFEPIKAYYTFHKWF